MYQNYVDKTRCIHDKSKITYRLNKQLRTYSNEEELFN